jgi:spore maturation protein B
MAHFFSNAIFLLFVGGIPLIGFIRKVKVYEVFVEGAKEGFTIAISIIPYVLAIIVGVGMFRAAGGFTLLAHGLNPIFSRIGFPVELLPIALVRPFSGGAAKGLFAEVAQTHGGNSFLAHTAGVMMGSTETTFYVLAVYFGAVAIRKTRYAVPVGLMSDFIAVIAAVFFAHLFFH